MEPLHLQPQSVMARKGVLSFKQMSANTAKENRDTWQQSSTANTQRNRPVEGGQKQVHSGDVQQDMFKALNSIYDFAIGVWKCLGFYRFSRHPLQRVGSEGI